MKLFILIIGIFFVFAGCAINQQAPSVCDTLESGQSVICDMAQEVGQSPETVAGILKLANVGALAADFYTALEADVFLDVTIGHLEQIAESGQGLTYMAAVQYVLSTMAKLSPEAQAAFIILQDFTNIQTGALLSEIDIQMMLKHLRDQKLIVAPFLVSE